ncbi:MAG: N-acetylmuramoyl-L-alanine amidase [Actinobacteria bacterium]|nr:N-acetylmuramoyl-L-alanine amidase [Actinomycetota bacterium]MBU1942745.1 N-acetylmuramoyl-L-alanine amidase [Actinomycetota bacterium]MBU2686067.1 N-acetylmuramoyl-L-alanine amidase [Actinomycetota bacterium]
MGKEQKPPTGSSRHQRKMTLDEEHRHYVRRNAMIVAGAVLAVGILAGGLVFFYVFFVGGHRVPKVVGLTYDQARKKVEAAGFYIEIDPMQDSSGKCGDLEVTEQDPKAGTDAGEELMVTVRLKGLHETPEAAGVESTTSLNPAPENTDQPVESAPAASLPAAGRTTHSVCIDPGHGSGSMGTVLDEATGLDIGDGDGAAGERVAMWQIAQYAKTRLEQAGYSVTLTKGSQDEKVTLKRRAEIGNTCEITIRLHYDTSLHAVIYPAEGQYKQHGSSPRVYVDPQVARGSEVLAEALFGPLQGAGITKKRNDTGGTSNNSGSAYVGSVFSKVPVVLIENDPGLVRDNPGGQDRVAQALVDGVNAYFNR